MLRADGWRVNHKRVERIWHQEGLKVPKRQPKRKKPKVTFRLLWLNDGSCVRLRPMHKDHVWSYDFMFDRTSDGRGFKILNIIDEYTRESLSIDIGRTLDHNDVLNSLTELFIHRGIPKNIRSDNGSEFIATEVRRLLKRLGIKTLYFELEAKRRPERSVGAAKYALWVHGSPWENGYIESFNGKLRDELLNLEMFDTLLESKILIERWRSEYNHIRPHSALNYRPPAPESSEYLEDPSSCNA